MTLTNEPGTAAAGPEGLPIYDAIGGRPALKAAVDGLFARLIADPELSRLFPAGVSDVHRAHVIALLGEALGGQERYRGPDLATAHRGLGISDVHFDRTAGHLDATLDDLGVPRGLTDQVIAIVAGLRPPIVGA